jgi:thioredoxin 1
MGAAALAVDDNNFEAEIEKHPGLAMLDFWATWCGPCQRIAPIVEELATEMAATVKIGKVDVDNAPDTAARFGVQSIPCLVLLKNGQEVDRVVGGQAKSQLKKWIEAHAS